MLSSPVDWSSPARVMIGDDVVTSGQVVEAVPDDAGNVRWDVRSALMLSDNRMPGMVLQNLSPSEVVYAAAREAGLDRDHMQIHGLDGLNAEAMWVLRRSTVSTSVTRPALALLSSSTAQLAWRC